MDILTAPSIYIIPHPELSGRYSGRSATAFAPAAAMGFDIERINTGATTIYEACRPTIPVEENPVRRAQFRRAYEAAEIFAEKPEGWLVFVGQSGSGKTHLAAAIANKCLADGNSVLYITAPDLLDYLRSTFNPNSDVPYDEFFEQSRLAADVVRNVWSEIETSFLPTRKKYLR